MQNLDVTALNGLNVGQTQKSRAIWVRNMKRCSVTVDVENATSPVGLAKLQASNAQPGENDDRFTPPENSFADIPNASVTITGNTTTGMALIPSTELAYRWVRVVYAYQSGAGGTITAQFYGIGDI